MKGIKHIFKDTYVHFVNALLCVRRFTPGWAILCRRVPPSPLKFSSPYMTSTQCTQCVHKRTTGTLEPLVANEWP